MPNAYPVSTWYPALASYTFPTVFVSLTPSQLAALGDGQTSGPDVDQVCDLLHRAIHSVPGSAYVHADFCAPTDAPAFAHSSAVRNGRQAWNLLAASEKVRNACKRGDTHRLGVHSYRRLDPVREFRLFIKGRRLLAMSQMRLNRHYRRLEGHRHYLWSEAQRLTTDIAPFLPADDLTVDVYMTSAPSLMVIDLNGWGPPVDPLLLRTWSQPWDKEIGLRLIPPPTRLSGDVEVSF